MAIKCTNLFHFKTIKNTRIGIFGLKNIPSGNPGGQREKGCVLKQPKSICSLQLGEEIIEREKDMDVCKMEARMKHGSLEAPWRRNLEIQLF
jgi:hypothetical protein